MHIFKEDNEIGKRGEQIFSRFLDKLNLPYRDVSDLPEYQKQDVDFIVGFGQDDVKFEVKNDTRIASTRNIFKADVMVIVSESERRLYMISSDSLKRFVEENKNGLRFISRVPGSNSCGYLVPISRLGERLKIRDCDGIW